MLRIYGSMLCPDCVLCREELDKANICYEYLDFSENLAYLKMFLALREGPAFEEVRKAGNIGIPCIQLSDGSVTLDWKSLL